MPDKEYVDNSNSRLVSKSGDFPEGIPEWVFKESTNVLEGSPFLGHISWLLCFGNEFGEITVSLLSKGSTNHISSLVHVWVTIHETFDTCEPLSEVRLRVFSIV